MLLICTARVSVKCIRIRSAHDQSARSKDCVCTFCALELKSHPEKRDDGNSLASILKGSDDAKATKRRR